MCSSDLDLETDGVWMTLRDCRLVSPQLRAEATGRLGLPQGTAWEWGETLIGDDFALAVDVDLAAAARGITGPLDAHRVLAADDLDVRFATLLDALAGTEIMLRHRLDGDR